MNKSNYKNLVFIFPFLKKAKGWFIAGIVGMIISSILSAPGPYLMGYIIDKVIPLNKNYKELFQVIGVLILLNIIKYGISILYQYYFAKVQQHVVNEIRVSMIEKIIDMPLSIINKKEKGYILGRISEVSSVGGIFSPTILGTFTGVLDFFSSLIIMINLNLKLTLMLIIIIPIYFLVAKHSSRKIYNTTNDVYEASAFLNGDIYEVLNGIEDIKLLNGKETQIKKIRLKVKTMIKSAMSQTLSFINFIQNVILINEIITALILLLSGILILNNQLTIGIYTSFSIYMSKILSNTQALGSLDITLKPICVSITRIKEFFKIENKHNSNNVHLNDKIESIKFKNVSFKYDDNSDEIINGLYADITKGDKVLIKGVNGSGKTTLIKLITGLYQPTCGNILINNKDYTQFDIKDIRGKIGIVSQSIFLFKGTILDNILYGNTKKTRDTVIELIDEYKLNTYINRFENGLDTEIIQNGSDISGGQAQIVAFLRAVIEKREIIILDEATSNLDKETRRLILNLLEKKELCEILIIISHQDDNLNFINKIIDLNNYKNIEISY